MPELERFDLACRGCRELEDQQDLDGVTAVAPAELHSQLNPAHVVRVLPVRDRL